MRSSSSKLYNFDLKLTDVDDSIDINGKATLKQSLTEDDIEKQKLLTEYREELTKVCLLYRLYRIQIYL